MTAAVWEWLAFLIPFALVCAGVVLLAWGLVQWSILGERRAREYGGRRLDRW